MNNKLPPNFNWQLYLDLHIDLRNCGMTTKQQAENHYIQYGKSENRRYHIDRILDTVPDNFDWRTYHLFNPDIAKLYPDKESAEKHYRFFGHKEARKFESTLSYEKLIEFKNKQQYKLFHTHQNYTVLINHQSSLTGAPVFLQDLANHMANYYNSLIFIDCFPNEYYDLHPDIKTYYHFGDAVLLKNILDSISFIDHVYSNSESLILRNLDMFDNYLYKTIFHLHECREDTNKQLDSITLEETIRKSNRFIFVAQQIIDDHDFSDLSKLYLCAEFLSTERIIYILDSITSKDKPNHRPLIGMCGSNCGRKNPTLFIDIAKKNPHYDFIWIGSDITQESIKNLTCIPQTKNPFQYLDKIDYLLLTSLRDPCPIVVLESMLMNKKIILLENNIKYKHNIALLENVHVITEHNDCADIITQKINQLNINTSPNTTRKNQNYIVDHFGRHPKYKYANKQQRTYNLCLSYFHKDDREIQYYTDLINSRLILDPDLKNVLVSVSVTGLSDIDNMLKKFTDKIRSDKLKITLRENAGFDIGGLIDILLSHHIDTDEYITYIHNKTNLIWREDLFRILYASDYYKNDTTICREYYIECETADRNRQIMSKHKFMNHLDKKPFHYISGTCFNTKMKNLKPLIKNIKYIKNNLTSINTDDKFWQEQMMDIDIFNQYYTNHKDSALFNHIDADARDVLISTKSKNLFELKQKYNRSGIPNFMFEHALERYIGYLITNNKKVNLV